MNTTKDTQIATFMVGKEVFGISIHSIKEIVRYPDITEVPKAPSYLKGITNLRGTVMPVIDARIRLDLPETEITEQTRIIVFDTGQAPIGLLVDKVKGVMSMENLETEPPPSIISSGIDRRFVSGVIKADKNLIMELDLEALCEIDIKAVSDHREKRITQGEGEESKTESSDEIQLVTFIIAGDEYAFPIENVKEVLRVGKITTVPEAPHYVLGMLSVRDSILPIIDIRKLFGFPSIAEDTIADIEEIKKKEDKIFNQLKASVNENAPFINDLDQDKSPFGLWIEGFNTSSELIDRAIKLVRMEHQKLYSSMNMAVDATRKNKKEEAIAYYEKEVLPCKARFDTQIDEFIDTIKKHIKEDQRILVIEIQATPIGILVDGMKQVVRLSHKLIEEPPSILQRKKAENIQGIAKLDYGKRLIMLINEKNIFDAEVLEELKNMEKRESLMETGKTASHDEEVQFVTFRLGNIEFAISIDDVQEINRLENITSVPRTPEFVEGVMNLRGNIIPVIDLRTRFDMEKRQYDESTRVIIVSLQGKFTGFVVDGVSEVLRVTKRYIEPPPDVIAGNVNTEFINGVCKFEDKSRMILIIDVSKILTKEEQSELQGVTQEDAGQRTYDTSKKDKKSKNTVKTTLKQVNINDEE